MKSQATMEVNRLRNLGLKVFKALNNMNPKFVKEIFQRTAKPIPRSLDKEVNETNTIECGDKSLRSVGSDIWNSLPRQTKKTDELL